MNTRFFRLALVTVMAVAAVFCAAPVSAAEEAYTVSFSVTVSNPKKNIPKNTEFILLIEGQPHAPLPDPVELTAGVNGTYEFAPIVFTEPGRYKYTVKQIAPEDKKLIADTKVYEIDVRVIRGEDGGLEGGFTITNQNGNGKPTIISFRNDYKSKSNANNNKRDNASSDADGDGNGDGDGGDSEANSKVPPPATGEPLSPAFGGLILSGAVIALLLAVKGFRRGKSVQGGAD